jgi:hypothetical protein
MSNPEKKQVAKAWEVITCSNGHPMYLIVQKIYEGQINYWLEFNKATVPLNGHNHEIHCNKCGKCFNWRDQDQQLHFYIHGKPRLMGGD